MGLRRLGRELVLQTLYSLEFIETADATKIKDYLPHYISKYEDIVEDSKVEINEKVNEFAINLLQHTVLNIEEIDKLIEKYSSNWSIDNLAQIDKAILRLGVYEITFTDLAAPICINEAIEISKKYSSESSGKFINGVLNAVAKGHKDE